MTMTPPKPIGAAEFEIGDLVRVRNGTHDPALPAHRTGLVIGVIDTAPPAGGRNFRARAYTVQFGTSILKFHPMWLEHITS
jgi:hypothetical protein